MWVGTGIDGTGTGGVRGVTALLRRYGRVDSGYSGALLVTYDTSKCAVSDFSTGNQGSTTIKVVSWTQ